jgi:hypothetical protein
MPSTVDCWVSSTTGVGFISFVSRDGISMKLTISDDCCSPYYNCTCALVLTLGFLEFFISSSFFGGAMVVSVECLLSLNGICALHELLFILLNLYHSLSILFLQMDSFLPRLCVVWASHEACRRC